MNTLQLGRIGIWSMELRFGDRGEAAEAAAELDELGYDALWIPGGVDNAVLDGVDALLAATTRATIATGIINIWKHEPADVAAWFKGHSPLDQDRIMLGLGISHAPLIGEAWKKPLAATAAFLDGLDEAGMTRQHLCLAALGPKMVELARDRTAGAHPYLVTPEHTATARDILGPGKVLAPEQGVILERDPTKARAIARQFMVNYAKLPNYRNNWLRLGFTQDDADAVSDRLIDALFAWGAPDKIAERVKAHRDAGADHVCVQIVRGATGGDMAGLRSACRELADVLI